MSLIRRAVLFTTLLVVASASFSQDAATTPTASQGVAPLPTATTATKDPDAVKALQNASAATLGFVALPQNLTGAGKMTRFSGDQTPTSDVTWKATSSGGVRIDAKFDGYPTTLLVSYGYARTADDAGEAKISFPGNEVALGLASFPIWKLTSVLADQTTDVTYDGIVDDDGEKLIKVHCALPSTATATTDKDSSGAATPIKETPPVDIFLDPQTFLVKRLASTARPNTGGSTTYPYEVRFGDYRSQNGVQVPFAFEERIGGQKTWSVALDSVAFNTTLTDADHLD
jgi:hypothetical protein